MRTTASVDSAAADLTHTAKESSSDARPVRSARKSHLPTVVRQTIFLVRGIFQAVLLPDLTDCHARQRPASGIQRGHRPFWCDRLPHRNQSNNKYHCCDKGNFAASTHKSIDFSTYGFTGDKSPSLTMSAVSSGFRAHCGLHSKMSAISL
jgi:hypothetical protein